MTNANNANLIAIYKADIKATKLKMKKSKARYKRFKTGEYKTCEKYPAYMHEEMQAKIIQGYERDIKQLETLILELV